MILNEHMRLRLFLLFFFLAGCAAAPRKEAAPAKIPPAGERHCLVFVVDGLGGPLAQQLMREGQLPNFKKYLYDRGLWVENVTSVFPSVTAAAMTSVMTGAYPGRHGIANFQWVDRDTGNYRSYIGSDIFDFNKDIDTKVKTLFQYFPKDETASFGLLINRGVGHSDSLIYTALNPLYGLAPQAHVAVCDFLKTFSLGQEFPRVMSCYEWNVDDRGHKYGPRAKVTMEVLRQADAHFGDLVKLYQERGHFDQTYFVLISDHGFAPVSKKFYVDKYLKQFGFKTKLISYNLGETKIPTKLDRLESLFGSLGKVYGFDAVIGAAGGGGATVDLVKNGGVPTDGKTEADLWKETLKYSDVRRYKMRNGKTVDVLELLLQPPAIDVIVLRDDRDGGADGERVVRIVGRSGETQITRKVIPGEGDFYKYEVVKGKDPLSLADEHQVREVAGSGRFYEAKLWKQILDQEDYPDIVVQVCQYFDTPRASTLYLCAAKDWSLNSIVKGRHAGPLEEEMKAIFMIAGPGIPHGKVERARIVDMVPTVLTLLGVKYDPASLDGQPLPEAVTAAPQPSAK